MTDSTEVWSILRILQWSEGFLGSKGIEAPRFEVEVLLAEALHIRRLDLYLQFERVLGKEEIARFKGLLLRRAKREPSAYILGRREFYGLDFAVNSSVLVPRPETEHLVDVAADALKGINSPLVIEVGAGSGNVSCAIAHRVPSARIYSTEISPAAATLARGNANALSLTSRVTVFEGDLFGPLPDKLRGRASAVVSNPPYIGECERESLPVEVKDYEPHAALFAGNDGLEVLRRLILESRTWLVKDGFLAFEIGSTQATAVTSLLSTAGYREIAVTRDYSGYDRIVSARQ